MSKAKTYGTLVVLAMAFVAMTILPVAADLVPTTFGFPVIVQNGSTSAFNQDTASATDFEAININFPPSFDGVNVGPFAASGSLSALGGLVNANGAASANVLPFGPVNLAFPDINQVVDQ